MKIIKATADDAPLIGRTVVEAIGPELARDFAGDKSVDDVLRLFTTLAARPDSQYSYRNALIAVDDDGTKVGCIVSYDGARLHELRLAFFEEVKRILGRDMDGQVPDECTPDEIYLDSLAVLPKYRGRGVATALIAAAAESAASLGKPLGLLCSKTNPHALHLYQSLGFKIVGETPFASEPMHHLQRH